MTPGVKAPPPTSSRRVCDDFPSRQSRALDTNICIYLMKHQPPEVRERFAACFVGDVVISAVTLAELEFGIACSSLAVQAANRSALESLLEDIMVAPFDAQAAKAYGPIRSLQRSQPRCPRQTHRIARCRFRGDADHQQRSGFCELLWPGRRKLGQQPLT